MKTLYPILLLLCLACTALARPLVVAHRGASGDAPENTIPAFELAWAQSADAIEGDFHLSRDGKIVCIHDRDTKKITGRKLLVKETDFKALRALPLSKKFSKGHHDLRIPSFAEVAATIPEGGKFYIEIKSDATMVPQLEEALADSNLSQEQIVVISFNADVIAAVKKAAPQTKANWLTSVKVTRSGQLEPSARAVIRQLRELDADGVSMKAIPELKEAYVQAVKGAGFEFHVWTVNNPEHAKRLAAYGVDSITTDYPGRLLAALGREDPGE